MDPSIGSAVMGLGIRRSLPAPQSARRHRILFGCDKLRLRQAIERDDRRTAHEDRGRMELSITTDKETYAIRDHATITVEMNWPDGYGPGSSAFGAILTVRQQQADGSWGSDETYPEFGLDRDSSNDPPVRVSGWSCHPIRSGRWGRFQASALIFEYERHEVGTVECEFVAKGPRGS